MQSNTPVAVDLNTNQNGEPNTLIKDGTKPGRNDKIYFPGLNGMRFLAALSVIIYHWEQMKSHQNLPNYIPEFTRILSPQALNLFFVLSGFLITYLLFVEQAKTGTIAIRAFYMRRLLRIWPVYYIILGLGFFILPNIPYFARMAAWDGASDHIGWIQILYLVFLPNVARSFYLSMPMFAGHSWSVGVEEQFYLLWPLVLKKVKNPLVPIFSVIFIFTALKMLSVVLCPADHQSSDMLGVFYRFMAITRIHCIAFGGFAAYLVYYKVDKILNFIYKPSMQILNIGIILFLFVVGYNLPYFNYIGDEVFTVLWSALLLNVATNPKTLVTFEFPGFDFLGKITYGIYLYHKFAFALTFLIVTPFLPKNPSFLLCNVIGYVIGLGLTIGISALSHKYIEKPFMNMKKKYTKVVSGDDAKPQTVSA